MTLSSRRLKLFPVLLTCTGIFLGIFSGSFYALIHDLPQINRLKTFQPSAVTQIYSSDDILLARLYKHQREPIPIETVPDHLIQALLVTEDRTFYSHPGVDIKGIIRALVHDLRAGAFKQGGSTISQQLAKTLFFSSEKSLSRKLKEMLVTLQIERRYTKTEILELYLNQIYLGSGAYGVEAAATLYFGKRAAELSLAESALIAGLPKAPSRYSPLNNPDLAKRRRAVVLGLMLDTGLITRETHDQALQDPMHLVSSPKPAVLAPYFIDYLLDHLQELGIHDLYTRGYRIQTTLDSRLQIHAENAVSRGIDHLENRRNRDTIRPRPQGALIALDIQTGGIRSLVGGDAYSKSPFDRATKARRQPGSAFKPFIYAVAVQKGIPQNTLTLDAPLAFTAGKDREDWRPGNFSGSFTGELTFRKALALSKNTPAIRVAQDVGIDAVIDLARAAGIRSPLAQDLSLALGTSGITLLELTAAYTVFPNQGNLTEPYAIETITDLSGRIVYQHHPMKKAVISRKSAAVITDMLKAVVTEGTGWKAQSLKTDVAGKTGTTDSFKDALFIGFSPAVASGVWIGVDTAEPLGDNETGSKAALPIWIEFMKHATADAGPQFFDIPDGTELRYMNSTTGETAHEPGEGMVKALFEKKES